MPKVSIVLPTYNGEQYIRESIDSVVEQTFKDWELLIVDDCSTDATWEIIREYEERDSRIRVLRNDVNKKLPNSLNIGFACASGAYLTWTSDDNCYHSNAIGVMADYLDHNEDICMVTGAMEFIDDNGRRTGEWMAYDYDSMYYSDCVGACFMYRSKVPKEIGGYDPDMFLVEDYDYWLRILIKYGEIGNIGDILYKYRNHGGSLTYTREKEIKRQLAILRKRYIDEIFAHLKNKKEYLCGIYYEFQDTGEDISEIEDRFKEYVPELHMDVGFNPLKDVIIYGAGDYGNRTFKKLNGKVLYYADRDPSKIGMRKNGIEIISLNRMMNESGKCQIIAAVSNEKIYEVLCFLMKNGVAGCSVCQSLNITRGR